LSIGSAGGGVPSKFTTPVTVAALSGLTTGPAVSAGPASSVSSAVSPPPPQPAIRIATMAAASHDFIR
jgi:hypothetical protein